MENSVLKAIEKFSLFSEGDTVTVALSGGADSMALLFALLKLKDQLKITVKAAHLNHLIRGDEAFRDEEFVKNQCEILGVELFCKRLDIPKIAKERGESTELTAREMRYEFLKSVNQGYIATAHTTSDNLETVILNLTRGTSIDGLCGIPVKRGIFVRPLILATREDVENYCRENNIPFITDSTNLEDIYTRNKIRHNIIPLLKEINPSVENSVIKTSHSLKDISDYIKTAAENFLKNSISISGLNLENFSVLPKSVATRVVIDFVNTFDSNIHLENCHIEEIYNICLSKGRTSIPKDYLCISDNKTLKISSYKENKGKTDKYSVEIENKNINFLKKEQKVNNLFLNNSLDCDKIIGDLKIRTRKSGDNIRLRNRGCTKPLTKLYSECAIPLSEREVIPVISDDKGVVWIYKIGVAARCAVTDNTKEAYLIKVKIEE